MRRLILMVSLVLLLSIGLVACQSTGGPASSGGATTAGVIKIGVNTEITGSIPVVGEVSKNGCNLAVKQVNDAGGLEVGGKKYKVELVIEDNEDKAESAAAVAQKLAAAGVLAMIGPNASRNAIPAGEVAETAKMPMITPWSTNPKTTRDSKTGAPKKYVFRTGFTDDFQGVVAAKFLLSELKSTKPAVLFDVASEYNKGIAEVYKKTLESQGVQMAAYESYTTGDKDFSAQLTKIVKSGADSLFLPNYYSEVPMQVQQAHKLGYTGKIFGSDTWVNNEIITLCGKECDGTYFSAHYARDIASPKAQAFLKAYKEAYNKEPDDVAALNYDAINQVFMALQIAGKLDREAIRDALYSGKVYEGVTGNIVYKDSGDPIKSAIMMQIQGDKFVYYKTINP